MSIDRDDKIVITGSSRGIGYHLAERFLELGFGVIGISRSEASLSHPRFTQIRADVGNLAEIASIRDRLQDPRISGIINNAGVHGPIGPFESNDLERWITTFYVNLFGAAALTQACLANLRQNRGFIIFLSGGGVGLSETQLLRLWGK